MKMPDDFQLLGGKKNANMICQNVPVCTARHMAENVKAYLDGSLDMVEAEYIRQDNTSKKYEIERDPNSLQEFLV